MQRLRNAAFLARLVLAWFALSLGVAVASPLVKPVSVELVCSAGSAKFVAIGDDGVQQGTSHGTLDCPLCLVAAAPGPAGVQATGAHLPSTNLAIASREPPRSLAWAAPPPARGPPLSTAS